MDPAVTGQPGTAHPLARHLGDFLTDLGNANSSAPTIRAYRGDLLQFAAHHDGEIGELSAAAVRAYLAGIAALAPSTRKRKRAAVASFCRWAVRHDLLMTNPMDKIDTIKVPKTLPRRGDPGMAGESAGAMSILTLMSMPQAGGLFRRAIAESGAAHNFLSLAEAQLVAGHVAAAPVEAATRATAAEAVTNEVQTTRARPSASCGTHAS